MKAIVLANSSIKREMRRKEERMKLRTRKRREKDKQRAERFSKTRIVVPWTTTIRVVC